MIGDIYHDVQMKKYIGKPELIDILSKEQEGARYPMIMVASSIYSITVKHYD